MKKMVLMIGFMLTFRLAVYGNETGKPFMTFYTTAETGGHYLNWAFIEDTLGVMYIGNGWGIQEFDGSVWRVIKIPNGSFVRSFARDSTGRIFVGSATELGYLDVDERGAMHYTSLLQEIPSGDRGFNYVWSVHATAEGIFFQARERIFRFQQVPVTAEHPGGWKLRVWRPDDTKNYFVHSYYLDRSLVVLQRGVGLMKMIGDSLNLIPGSQQFIHDRSHIMLPLPGQPGSWLLGTVNRGLFLYNGRTFKPFPTEADELFIHGTLYDGKVLPDGSLALGTLSRGFVIIDSSGKLKVHLTKESGLLSNTIAAVFVDHQKNIWLGMAGGVGVLEYNSGLSRFPIASGAVPFHLQRHQGILYASATDGVYYLDKHDSRFKYVKGMENSGPSNSLIVDGNLYAANVNGIYLFRNSNSRLALPYSAETPAFNFLYRCRSDSSYIMAGAINGMGILKYDVKNPERLRLETIVEGVHEYIRQIVEINPGTFWLSTYNAGIIRLHFRDNNFKQPVIERFGPDQGLPVGITSVFQVTGRTVFGTGKGIYQFDEKTGRFLPDPFFIDVKQGVNPGECVVVADADSNIWANAGQETVFYLRRDDGSYQTERGFTTRFSNEFLYTIYPENPSLIWFGTTNGAIRYTRGEMNAHRPSFPAVIRCVKASGDTLSFGGHMPKHMGSGPRQIPYRFNALTFEVSALFYVEPAATKFRIMLEGYDREWSAWSTDKNHNYTNLSPGSYVFRVIARNISGEESSEAAYAFVILKPWYATWLAWLAYLLLAALAIYSLVHFRTRKLKARSRDLEKIVGERTAELEKQKENVEQLNLIGRNITSSLSIENIIHTVYENVNKLMDASVFTIGLHKPEDDLLEFPAAIDKHQSLPRFTVPLSNEYNLAAWCFNQGKEVIINDFMAESGRYFGRQVSPVPPGSPESVLYLPLRRKEKIIGVINTQSFSKNAYTNYHLNMLRNIATYTAIALENADAYRRLATLLNELTTTQDKLFNQAKLAALGAVTAGIAHEIKNPLNFVNNFAALNAELVGEMQSQVKQARESFNDNIADEMEYITTTIKENSVKILEHGKRAENIVHSMLQHSRGTSGERMLTDINALLEEAIKLTYHGMRAQDASFEIAIETSMDPSIGKIRVIPQEINRAFINIINNACYETHRKKAASDSGYIPALSVTTKKTGEQVRICIRDNGNGVPQAIRAKLYMPFFTTKPVDQGTGLGLSIAYDIIVHQHKGQITFETEEGSFTEFMILLPFNK